MGHCLDSARGAAAVASITVAGPSFAAPPKFAAPPESVERTVEVGLTQIHDPSLIGIQWWMTGGLAVGDFDGDG